jgi:hypothetical protein
MLSVARNSFPSVKLIISSITPRDDELDKAVSEIDQALQEKIKYLPDVVFVDPNNLRNLKFFHDVKHLNRRYGVPIFANNI